MHKSRITIIFLYGPDLKPYLQEADSHKEQTVGSDPTSENLIEVPLQKELLQHQHQIRQHRIFLQDKTRWLIISVNTWLVNRF